MTQPNKHQNKQVVIQNVLKPTGANQPVTCSKGAPGTSKQISSNTECAPPKG